MILIVAVTLVGWGISRQNESAELAAEAEAIEAQAYATKQKQSEMTKLQKERKSLRYQLKI